MSTTQTLEREAPIELIIEQDKDGQVTANVPVRWKISSEMALRLAEEGVDPFMLLVVTNGDTEMDRYLVPLKAGMTFLQMGRPGTNVIHATIVWRREDEEPVKRAVLEKDNYGNYKFELLRSYVPGAAELWSRIDSLSDSISWGGLDEKAEREARLKRRLLRAQFDRLQKQPEVWGLNDFFYRIERTPEGDSINVEVPKEMFAPPPGWLAKKLATLYGSFWQRSGWRDQCDMRRRAWFTALTLPIAALLAVVAGMCWLVVKALAVVAVGVLLFFGRRNIDYSVIYEPKNIDLKAIWRNLKPSFWFYEKKEAERFDWNDRPYVVTTYVKRNPVIQYFSPPFLLMLFIVNRVLGAIFGAGTGAASWLGTAIGVVIGALVFGAGALFIKRWGNKRKAAVRKERAAVATQKSKQIQRELEILTRGGAAKLSELPREQRSVQLRYLNLKAAVCKPFAR